MYFCFFVFFASIIGIVSLEDAKSIGNSLENTDYVDDIFSLLKLYNESTNGLTQISTDFSTNDDMHRNLRQFSGRIESAEDFMAKALKFDLINTIPRDTNCYTQGFQIINGTTYIHTCGLYKQSKVEIVDMLTGQVLKQTKLPNKYFAEGVTQYNNTYIVLTWREKTIFKYDLSLNLIGTYPYKLDGWGIAADKRKDMENSIYTTDGSNRIYTLNPLDDFKIKEFFSIKCFNGMPTYYLNEMEFVLPHYLYINVAFNSIIARVNLETKKCDGFINFRGIYNGDGEIMNGITTLGKYNEKNISEIMDAYPKALIKDHIIKMRDVNVKKGNYDVFLVTGKLWENGYLIIVEE